jgi:hypothetical protein
LILTIPAPDAVLKLCETFAEHREHFRSGNYNKFQLRDTLPKGTRLSVGRENAWDSRTITLEADGRFDLANLPPGETLSLWTRVAGYRDSAANASFESRSGLRGRLDADIALLGITTAWRDMKFAGDKAGSHPCGKTV